MGRVDMRFLAPTVCEVFGVRKPQSCEGGALPEIVRDMGHPRRLVTVVLDGLGTEALEAHADSCPNLRSISRLHYLEIRAVRPPKTPVNFATMATGASQRVHGVSEKTDPLRVETIFRVLEESGISTCVAGRQSGSPAHLFSGLARHRAIAGTNTDAEVLELVLDALRHRKPGFTLVQFLDIDEAEHEAGPFGEAVRDAVLGTDVRLGRLAKAVAAEGGGMVVLADHGQHEVVVGHGDRAVTRGKHDGTSPQDFLVPLVWCNPDELAALVETAA